MIRNFLIVAGGIGSRMGNEIPKQFIKIGGKPVLLWTLERANQIAAGANFIVVLPAEQIEYWKLLCQDAGCQIPHQVVAGGKSRFASVNNGLALILAEEGFTAVHDGVRPFFSKPMLDRLEETASRSGNAIPAIVVTDTIRTNTATGNQLVDRSNLFMIQTPQLFQTQLLKRAYKNAVSDHYTDDASVLEGMGEAIQLVEGESDNIKITRPIDLIIAESLIHNQL